MMSAGPETRRLDGIRRGLNPGEPLSADPGHPSDEDRNRLGIERLPAGLGLADVSPNDEARQHLFKY